MSRSLVVLLPLLLLLVVTAASADMYTWTDTEGTVHFTENPAEIPRPFRSTMRKLGETPSSPQVPPPSPPPEATAAPAPRTTAPPAAGGSGGTYGGRSFEEWSKEFSEREAAMTAIRKRIVEVQGLLQGGSRDREASSKLATEHQQLTAQFKGMKAEYFQRVEIARKAGLTINLQE